MWVSWFIICLRPYWEVRFAILEPSVVVLSILYHLLNFVLKSPSAVTKNGFVSKILPRIHCVKRVRIWSFGLHFYAYFPAFGLNTERYEVSLRIQSKCGKMREKMRTRITPNTDTFYAVISSKFFANVSNSSWDWLGDLYKDTILQSLLSILNSKKIHSCK